MRYGHVAVVARVVNSREVLVDHANWAPHRGRGRGQVSKMVAVTDVSPHNDWTEVRVWNASTRDFGTRTYPTYGFIYPASSRSYIHQAAATIPQEEPNSALHRRLSPPGDPVLATADRQIAAALADGCDVVPTAIEANVDETRAVSKPAETKAVDNKPVDAKSGDAKTAGVTAISDVKTVETIAVETKPVEARATVVAVNDIKPTMVAVATATSHTAVATSDGIWEGDSAAAKQVGSGRY